MPRIVGYINPHDRVPPEDQDENSGLQLSYDYRNQSDAWAHEEKLQALVRKNAELEGKLHSKEQEVEQVIHTSISSIIVTGALFFLMDQIKLDHLSFIEKREIQLRNQIELAVLRNDKVMTSSETCS
jgi:hypothetical protein